MQAFIGSSNKLPKDHEISNAISTKQKLAL